jgi:SAM-dependent methyltransferase
MAEETAAPDYMVGAYFDYQNRYAESMRENDRVLLSLMSDALAVADRGASRLLDIGCSNGNLLRHLRGIWPNIEYWGGDIQPEVIARCRSDPLLAGIRFEVMNARDLSSLPKFEIVVANAVLFRFPGPDLAAICGSIARAMAPGGWLFTLDFYHPFSQDLAIEEHSAWHPEGLKLHFRSYETARRMFSAQGFTDIRFFPFEIPIDLPPHADPSNISTYTRQTADGARLQFRGILFQPWCHLTARKA